MSKTISEAKKTRKVTGLKVGRGRWTKELCEGDTVETKGGEIFIINYQPEWGAFIAESDDGGLLFLAQNSKWFDGDDFKLDISQVKIISHTEQRKPCQIKQ